MTDDQGVGQRCPLRAIVPGPSPFVPSSRVQDIGAGGDVTRDIELGVLGPPLLRVFGAAVRLPPGRQAGLLARLTLSAGRTVQADELAADLWSDARPSRSAVHVLVCRTRQLLGSSAKHLETVGDGYRLAPDAVDTDLAEFRSLVTDASGARSAGDANRAGVLLDLAELLWRGRAFEGLASLAFTQDQAAMAEDERLTAQEDRAELHLASGELTAAVRVARHLVRERPFGERRLASSSWRRWHTWVAGGRPCWPSRICAESCLT